MTSADKQLWNLTESQEFYAILTSLQPYLPDRIRLDDDGDIMAIYHGVAEAVHGQEGSAMMLATLLEVCEVEELDVSIKRERIRRGEFYRVVTVFIHSHRRPTLVHALARALLDYMQDTRPTDSEE